MLIGNITLGPLSDKLGRKPVYISGEIVKRFFLGILHRKHLFLACPWATPCSVSDLCEHFTGSGAALKLLVSMCWADRGHGVLVGGEKNWFCHGCLYWSIVFQTLPNNIVQIKNILPFFQGVGETTLPKHLQKWVFCFPAAFANAVSRNCQESSSSSSSFLCKWFTCIIIRKNMQ